MTKIISWIAYLNGKMKKAGKLKWFLLLIPAVILGAIVVGISMFTKGDRYDSTKEKIKKAKKATADSSKSGRAFLRKRTKFKHKKL